MDSRIKVIIEGVDGSVWHVSGQGRGAEGVIIAQEPGQLYDAPVTTMWQSTAKQVGGSYRGLRHDVRDIPILFDIAARSATEWEARDYAFRRAFDYEKKSKIVVTTVSGTRELAVQLSASPEYQESPLPGQVRRSAKILLHLRAGNPFWLETVETSEYVFDGTNYVGAVTVSNPTDVPMPLVWVVKSPASILLPDYSFKDDDLKDRLITMPFQPLGTDVRVEADLGVEQVVAANHPNYWSKMRGQFFMHQVPPFTDDTVLPIAVNPLPWLTTAMAELGIPITIPAKWLYGISRVMSETLKNTPPDTVLSWTPEKLAGRINAAMGQQPAEGAPSPGTLAKLTVPTIGELITRAYGSVNTMAGAGVKCYMRRYWSRPWGA